MDVRASERQTIFFVRRGVYALITAEVQVSWIPAACPLRKDCYTRRKGEDGVVSLESLTTTSTVSLGE